MVKVHFDEQVKEGGEVPIGEYELSRVPCLEELVSLDPQGTLVLQIKRVIHLAYANGDHIDALALGVKVFGVNVGETCVSKSPAN